MRESKREGQRKEGRKGVGGEGGREGERKEWGRDGREDIYQPVQPPL